MAPSGSKRQNAMLERSYKKATGVRDERKGAYVNPTRVIEAAFLFFALKALNNHCESTHGISPLEGGEENGGRRGAQDEAVAEQAHLSARRRGRSRRGLEGRHGQEALHGKG